MEEFIVDNGRMGNNMGKEYILIKRGKRIKGIGNKVKELCQWKVKGIEKINKN